MCVTSLMVHLICFILGADRIVITGLQPNPGGDAQTLVAEGRFWVAQGNKLVDIKLIAEFPESGQLTSQSANRAKAEWNGKLLLPAGNYDCRVEMMTKNAAGELHVTRTATAPVIVK